MEQSPKINIESKERISSYNIRVEEIEIGELKATLYKVGFGRPAQNDQIVKDVLVELEKIENSGTVKDFSDNTNARSTLSELALINGPASLPVSMVLGNYLDKRFKAVAVFDLKLGKYVVSIANDSQYSVGDLVG